MVLEWPHSYGTIREGLVPEDLLQQMRRESGTVAQCPNFWTAEARHDVDHHARLMSSSPGVNRHRPAQSCMRDPGRPCTAFEAAIAGLYPAIQSHLSSPCAGAEWWVQVRWLLPWCLGEEPDTSSMEIT